MLKIAIASDNGMVTRHFGHCESFMVFEADNGTIIKSENITSPGHRPGFLPNYLNDLGVNVIISGGMGGGAIDLFNEHGIEVLIGVSGEAKKVVEAYLAGELVSTGSACKDHQHHDSCGGH